MSITSGDTFMLEDEDGGDEHLHVVLTQPNSSDEVITASISTRRRRSESLVCIFPGEHPFVVVESIVAYRHAAIRTCTGIEGAVTAGLARRKARASDDLVQKILAGLIDSDFTPPNVRAFYREIIWRR